MESAIHVAEMLEVGPRFHAIFHGYALPNHPRDTHACYKLGHSGAVLKNMLVIFHVVFL